MTITLAPGQATWLQAHVARGGFDSIEAEGVTETAFSASPIGGSSRPGFRALWRRWRDARRP